MEFKNKGKVHPSPSSSSSMLNLLPAAILSLVSVLSLDDREVLAYMITRSMKSSTPTFSTQDSKKKSTRKASINGGNSNPSVNLSNHYHTTPMFDCDCFHCYTSYWYRWDSSPNRDLIHRAIEAFEDHLTSGETPRKVSGGRTKRRERIIRQEREKLAVVPSLETAESVGVSPSPESGVTAVEGSRVEDAGEGSPAEDVAGGEQKGLATKVLPDVLGFINSSWWSLWSPNL